MAAHHRKVNHRLHPAVAPINECSRQNRCRLLATQAKYFLLQIEVGSLSHPNLLHLTSDLYRVEKVNYVVPPLTEETLWLNAYVPSLGVVGALFEV